MILGPVIRPTLLMTFRMAFATTVSGLAHRDMTSDSAAGHRGCQRPAAGLDRELTLAAPASR